MAVTISKIQIPELDYIENYLDDSDEFVVFDNREVGTSKARKVTYQDIKDNFINPTGEGHEIDINNGIDYNFPDENTLRIIRHRYVLTDAYKDENSGTYVHGYMSAADKQTLDQLKETDMGKLNTSFNASVRTDNTTNTFTPFNIQSIQGVGAVNTRVEASEQNGNILKISVDNISPSTTVRSSMIYEGQELSLDFLQAGNGVSVTKETRETSTGSKNLFKLNIDTQALIEAGLEVDTSIKAEINNEEKTITKLIAGENVSFSENEEGQLTISSEGGSGEITPVDITTNTKVYTCNSLNEDSEKVILENVKDDEIFTVYFANGFGDNNSNIPVFLRTGSDLEKKPIYYNTNVFNWSIIKRYAVFRKLSGYYALLLADSSAGRGIRTTDTKADGTGEIILYDGTRISFLNNLDNAPIVQLNYNNKIDNNYLDIFDNGKIKPTLLPNSEDGGTVISIGWPIGEADYIGANNTYNVSLPGYSLAVGNIVAVRFRESPVVTHFNLKIGSTPAYPVSYHGATEFSSVVFDNTDTALFIFDGDSYVVLSIDSTIGDSLSISTDAYITSISPRKQAPSVDLLNSSILDENNQIREGFLPGFEEYLRREDLLTENNTLQISSIPIYSSDYNINVNYNNNNNMIQVGLNLPNDYDDPSSVFLNGNGDWIEPPCIKAGETTITNITSDSLTIEAQGSNLNIEYDNTFSVRENVIPFVYPVGSVYQTLDLNFNPNGNYIPTQQNPEDYIFTLEIANCPNLSSSSGNYWLTENEIDLTGDYPVYWDLIDYNNGILTWVKKQINKTTEIEKINKIAHYRNNSISDNAG